MNTKKFIVICIITLIFVAAPILYYCFSFEFLVGLFYLTDREGNANEWVDNLVTDVREAKQLSSLRQWADEITEKQRSGTLKTNGYANYVPYAAGLVTKSALKLDPNEIDEKIRTYWRKPMFGLKPEAVIRVSESGEPLYVSYCWYLKGVIIAGPNYPSLDFKYYYAVEAKPGIFAYSIEK
jgi:hypothetical protein